MNTVKFCDIPTLINDANVRLVLEDSKAYLRLHSATMFNWGADTAIEYLQAESEIDKVLYKGKGWHVYAWYDGSSFKYWMKDVMEQNYIQITISFDNEEVEVEELKNIYTALDKAMADADAIENKYSFDPCIH